MPSRSQRRRGKYSVQGQKRKGKPVRPTLPEGQPAAAQVGAVASSEVPLPSASSPVPAVEPAAVRHPYITAELRTIGILAVVVLIILAVLVLVLS